MSARSYLPVQEQEVTFDLDQGPEKGIASVTGTVSVIWFEPGDVAWLQVNLHEPIVLDDNVQATVIEVRRDKIESLS